ncbi:MAG: hypothetical protein JRI95_13820 [Deltaproteobacteria bacterium]|nr:hypothetical protein [Deltaproteobacteria bacterium]
MNLIETRSLNQSHEIKRALRLALAKSDLSRDQIVDEMNDVAHLEGIEKRLSKATLDSWTKNADRDRLPTLFWLTIFCFVLQDIGPIRALIDPLGYLLIGERDQKLLDWAKAEQSKRRATKKARVALEFLDNEI